MFKIKYLKDALNDLSDIQSYIAEDNVVSSVNVLIEIKKTIEYLKNFPYIWTLNDWKFRKLIEPKYNFTIIYLVKQNNIIEIVSIFKYKNSNF